MPSLTTVYRAIVMIVAGVIVVQGWQLYGPSAEQVTTFATAAFEKAQAAWNGSGQQAASTSSVAVDPRGAAPPLAEAAAVVPPSIGSAPQLVPLPNAGADTTTGISEPAGVAPVPSTPTTEEDAVAKLLTQLQTLGAADAQIVDWGSSGQLYRCCCRAKFAETSPLARHFEAVADERTAAVEQVVAKVEAWRTEQQNLLR